MGAVVRIGNFERFLPVRLLAGGFAFDEAGLGALQILGGDFDNGRGDTLDGFQAIDADEAGAAAVAEIDAAIGGLGDAGPEVFAAEGDAFQVHAALGGGHGPGIAAAFILEERGDEEAIGGEEIDRAHVAIDGPDGTGVAVPRE